MQIHKVIEIVFSILILLFLAMLVMGILIGVTIVQELAYYEINFWLRVLFVFGMTLLYFYIIRSVINRIKDYARYF